MKPKNKIINDRRGGIPKSYLSAKWRNTLPFDRSGNFGIGFDLIADDKIVRLKCDLNSAINMIQSIEEYLDSYGITTSHCDKSRGMPRRDVLKPTEGVNVCPPP